MKKRSTWMVALLMMATMNMLTAFSQPLRLD
jgi:hypothetical protein